MTKLASSDTFRVGDPRKVGALEIQLADQIHELRETLAKWERVRPIAPRSSPVWSGVKLDATYAVDLDVLLTSIQRDMRRVK